MAYYYDDEEREREEEERQREWQEWQNYVQSNSTPSTDYGAGTPDYSTPSIQTQSAGFGAGAQGNNYYNVTPDEAKTIAGTQSRLGRTDFQTYSGDWMKPFQVDWLNTLYNRTIQKLQSTETKGKWNIAEDAFGIVDRYGQLFYESIGLGDNNLDKSDTYSGAADKEYERLLGQTQAKYETYGKSAQELLDKMTGMGWKSDRQLDQEDADRLAAKYGVKGSGWTDADKDWAETLHGAPGAVEKYTDVYDRLPEILAKPSIKELTPEEREAYFRIMNDMPEDNIFLGMDWQRNPDLLQKVQEYAQGQKATVQRVGAANGTESQNVTDDATWARMEWGKENREKVDKYQTSFLNINGIAQRVKKKGYESLDDDEKEIWQQALMAMGEAGLDATDWMTGGNDDPAISKWLSDWGMEQATLYDDIKEIYPVRPETTSYQQGYINAYRQTPEGAKAWYEEAKGTKDEQKARDNLYFLQKEEEYAQVPNMPGFENVTLEEAEREMPGREYKKFMTDKQKRIYLYLKKYAEGSPAERLKKANDYLKYLSYDIDKKVTENNVTKMRALGENGVGGAIGASAASVGTNMLAGQGFWEVAGQKFKQWVNGLTGQGYEPINYYTQGNMWGRMTSGAREGVMNQVDWRVNILGHETDIFDFVYGTMMSGIDSAAAMAMGKGAGGLAASLGAKGKTAEQVAKWTGALILGSGAAQNAMIEAYERTGDDNQALMAGVVSGIFETLFEEWSIENFFSMSNAMTKDDFVKTLLKNSATSAFTNFSEELNTEVANILYDRFAGGDASEWNNQIKWYTDRGLEPDEAFAKVCWDKTWQAIEAGAGGALMGLFFGATGTAQSYNATQKANSQSGTNIVKSGTLEALTQIAETFGEDSASGRALKAIQGKKGNGKNNRNVGALYRAIHDDLHSSPEMQETVRSRVKGDVLETLMEMNGITPNRKAAPTVQKADTQTQAAAEEAAPNHQAEGADETLAPTAEEAAPIAPAAEENAPGAEEAAPEHQAEGAENIPWNQPQALTPAQRQFRNRMIANENYQQAANRGRTGGAYYTVTMDAKGNLVADELHKADGSVEQVTEETILKPAEELGYNAEEAEALMRPADQTQPTQQPAQPAPHPGQQANPRTMRANEATTRQASATQPAATQQAQPGPVQGPQQQNVEQMQMLQIAAEGLSKMIAGEELSEQEMQAIAANPGAMQLMREMLVGDSAETTGTTENEEAAAEETAQPAAADEDEALPDFVRPVRRGEAALEATERKADESQNVQTQGEGRTEETTQPSAVRRAEMTPEQGELRRKAEGNSADIEAEAQQKAEERQRQREMEAVQEEQRAKLGENKTEPSATRRAEMTQAPGELRQNMDEETKGRIGEEAAQLEAEKNRRRALEEEGKRREARAAEGEEAREEYRTPEAAAETQQPAPKKQRKVKIRSEANGQEHAIHAIKAGADGSVQVTLDNGQTVDADDLDMDEATREFAENTPKGMDGEGAAAMINNFDETSGVKPGDYASGFEQYYQAGKRGRAFTAVRSIYGNEKLTLAQRQAAYEAGVQEAQRADEKADTQTAENAAKYGYETLAKAAEDQAKQIGVVFQRVTGKVSKGVQEQLALIDEFAKRFQLQIRVNDSLKGGQANGEYVKGTNTINLALDAEEGLLTRVVSHEGYHYIADQMKGGVKALSNIIKTALEGVEGFDLQEEIRKRQEFYERHGETLDAQAAEEEICANSVLDVIGSQEFIDSVYAEQQRTGDTGLVARIREWISKTAAALKDMLAKYSTHNTEARAMLTQASDWISTIQEAYLGAMEQITQNRTEAEYGLTQGAKGDAAVQEYQAAMEQATTQEKADQALDQLVTDLLVRTQEDAVAEAEEKDRREAEREEAREEYYEEEADESEALEEEAEDEAEREERRAAEREEAEEEYYEAEDEAEYAEEAEDEAEYVEEEAEEEAEETDEATDEGTAAAEVNEPEQQQKKKTPRLAQILAQRRSEQGGVRRNATITAEQRAAFDERTRQLREANQRAQRNLNEMTQRFAGALEQYGQGNIALAPALEGAGFQASDPSLNPAMTYAARQVEQSNRKRGKRGRVFDFKSDARATERTAADYSYQAMVAKPDMQITQMGDVSDEEVSRYSENTREFGREMRQNVIDSGDPAVTVKTAPNGVEQVFVKVGDIAKDVQVAVDSFRHSIGRQITKEYAQVCQSLTGILKNSIASNELNGREAKEGRKAGQATNYSTVLIGVGETENAYVPVRFIVDNRTWKMTDYDILATISKDSIKKEGADISSRGIMNQEDSGPTTPSHTMKVSDFLELVKNSANISAVVSKDIAEKMGFERPYDSKISSSLKFDLRSDAAYQGAVENGDMETAQRMVDEAAEASIKGTANRDENGKLRKFYHGTNSDTFTVFDKNTIGTAREGDTGFFGKGFYFAYSKGEAGMYGRNVMEAYLQMEKPFNFETELNTYEGEKSNDYNGSRAVFAVNFAEKFPELAKRHHVTVVEKEGGKSRQLTLQEFADEFKEVYDNKEFHVEEVDGEYGKEWVIFADPVTETWVDGQGQEHSYQYYDFQQKCASEEEAKNKVNQAFAYLREAKYRHISIPASATIIMETDFTEELKKRGYDSVIQSEKGDEAVVFEPEQIKSSDAATYDDNGELIPLSERFNTEEKDIRYDLRSDAAYDVKGENIKEGVEDDADFWSDIQNSADAENALELVQRLDESMGDETKGKWEPRLSAIAQDIIDKTESKYGKNKLMKELRVLFSAMDDKRMGLGEKVRYLHGIMNDVMDQTIRLKDVSEEQQAVRALLKAHPFALTEAQKNELSYGLGARNFIRKNYGTIRVVADKGSVAYLEDLWNDLNAIDPGAFKMDVSHLDMPAILDAYLEKGKNTKANHSTPGGDGTLATDLTFQTLLQYYDIPTAFRNTQKLREEFRQKLQDYKNNYAQKLEERATASKEREEQRKARDKARNEISRKARYINTRLLNPTDSRHVPQGLQEAARRGILPMIEKTGVFSGADAARLRREYSLLKPGGEGASMEAARAYDPEIEEKLERLAQTMEGRRLAELTQDELDDVNDIMGNLQKMIVDANDMQVAGRKMKVSAAAEGFLRHLKGMKRSDSKILQTMGDLAYKNMTPTYYGDKVGGLVKDMVGDLMEDQNKWAFTMKKAKGKLTDLMKKYDVNQWINDKNTLKFTTEQGDLIELNRDEALALYATWKRETTNKRQNANHLRIGGFMYQKGTKYEGVDTNAPHAISAQDMAQVMDYLGETQMQFADEMVEYLSRDMAALGNETSMALYGYEKFGEGYYFPYSSDRGFLQTSLEADEAGGMEAIRNSGMTKATVRHASNPVVVKGFMETWADHVNKMAMYNAFAETTADLNSIYNYRTAGEMKVDAATGEEYVTAPMSLRVEMEKALGPEAVNYLKNLVKDINGGVRAEERTKAGKMLSLFKKGSVAGNLSVVLQQPSAFARAMNMVSPKYMLGIKGIGTLKEAREHMYQYSGVALIKEMGRFDTATGKSAVGWMLDDVQEGNKLKRIMGYVDDVTGYGAEKADEWTWAFMWAGIENEVKALAPDLEAGSEEFYQTVAQRFNDVMNHTQVYDSVMSKSQMMRGQSTFDKMVTSFMAEPTLTANMLMDAMQNITKPGGKSKALRAAATFVNAAFVNALLKSIATAFRKGKDEDRTYIEKYLGDLAGNFMEDISPSGIISLFPYARDVVSLFEGYDVNRSDMDAIEQVQKAMKAWQNDKATMEDKLELTFGAVGNMLGIPVKNIWRDTEGVFRTIFNGAPISETSWRDIKYTVLDNLDYKILGDNIEFAWDDSRKAYYGRMVDALERGDLSKYDELRGYEEETNGVKPDTVKTGMKAIIKEKVLRGEYDTETAVRMMADHLGDKESNAYNTVNKWVETAAHEGEEDYSYSKYGALSSAIEKGEGISEEVQKLVEHGTDKKSVQSAITSEMKPKYLALVQNGDTVGAANLKAYILAAYGALGLDRDKMNKNIDKWVTDSQKKK